MRSLPKRALLDRVCDLLRIPDDRRHHLRLVGSGLGLSDDDPVHVYLVVGEVVKMAHAAYLGATSKIPEDIGAGVSRAISNAEQRLEASIDEAAAKTGAQIEIRVGKALKEFGARERRRHWPLFAAGLPLVVVLCLALGWTFADRSHLSFSLFWSEVVARGTADEWQRIIELNPHLPNWLSTCAGSSAHSFKHDGGIACRSGIWLSSPTTADADVLHRFLRDPVLFIGPGVYLLTAVLGALASACGAVLLTWWRKRS